MSFAGHASATVVIATFEGTVAGLDGRGLFGAVGENLTGPIEIAFTYDNSLEFVSEHEVSTVGHVDFVPMPFYSATATIGGVALDFLQGFGTSANVIIRSPSVDGLGFIIMTTSNGREFGPLGGGLGLTVHFDSNTPDGYRLADPYSAQANGSGSFISTEDCTRPGCNGLASTSGQFTLTSVDIEPVASGIPEPETWGLVLTGFLGLGTALRRRTPAS